MGMLDGRVAIVTGAGRGLGRCHALELARHGATVVVNDLGVGLRGEDEDAPVSPAEEVVAEIEAMGGRATADGTSVTDWDGMAALVARTVDAYGSLDVVVNNAGFVRDRMLVSMTEEEFDAVVAVHLKGAFALTRHACAHWRDLAKAGRPVSGRVVNTTSGAGLFGNIGQANYAPAKSAVATLTTVTAMEMQRFGVTANAIAPIAATRMLASAGITADLDAGWSPLDPANASPVVAWLASEASGWLTGAVLRIDGNEVNRVGGWHKVSSYRSRSGEALTAEELDAALRGLYGIAPGGLTAFERGR